MSSFISKLLCEVTWGLWVNSLFQIQPQILDQIEIWTLTQPLKNINIVAFKPLLCSFMLKLVVLLGKSSPKWQTASGFPTGLFCTLLHLFYPPTSQVFQGQTIEPPQNRFRAVPFFGLNFLMIYLTVLQGMFSNLEIFFYPPLTCAFHLFAELLRVSFCLHG